MNFELFMPAFALAGIFFVLFNLIFFFLIERLSDKLWSLLVGGFLSVCIYVFIVGIIYRTDSHEYLPDYLFNLLF